MRSLSVLLLFIVACSSHAQEVPPDATPITPDALGPYEHVVESQDVSLLYPLPAAAQDELLLQPTDSGAYGALLPQFIGTGATQDVGSVGSGTYQALRLIAVRLDPCSARKGCGSEVRAVFQPISSAAGGGALDGAVHVFYAVPTDELVVMLEEILALKHASGAGIAYGAQLGVQPILAATGLDGDFAKGLRKVLLKHLGTQRIERVTLMDHIFPDEDGWLFEIFDRVGTDLVLQKVVNTNKVQQVILGGSAIDGMIAGISADAQTTPTLPELGLIAARSRPATVTPQLEMGFAEAIAAQHPLLHDSENTDCGSCHVAEGARRVGLEIYGLHETGAFTSARSLTYVRDNAAVTNVHAFSYLGTSISVMQRTANESALAADRLQAMLPGAP